MTRSERLFLGKLYGTTFESDRWRSLLPVGVLCLSLSFAFHLLALVVLASSFVSSSDAFSTFLYCALYVPSASLALISLYRTWSTDPGAIPAGARPLEAHLATMRKRAAEANKARGKIANGKCDDDNDDEREMMRRMEEASLRARGEGGDTQDDSAVAMAMTAATGKGSKDEADEEKGDSGGNSDGKGNEDETTTASASVATSSAKTSSTTSTSTGRGSGASTTTSERSRRRRSSLRKAFGSIVPTRVRSVFQRKQRGGSPLLGAADADEKEAVSIAHGGVLPPVEEGVSSDNARRGGVRNGGSLDGDETTWASANFSVGGHSTAADGELSTNFGGGVASSNEDEALPIRRCAKCDSNYKPPRAHHDRHTGRCVVKLDHYCPWVCNAIGALNHKLFVLTLLYTFLCSFLSFVLIMRRYARCGYGLKSAFGGGGGEYVNDDAGGASSGCGRSAGFFAGTLVVLTAWFLLFSGCMLWAQVFAIRKGTARVARLKMKQRQQLQRERAKKVRKERRDNRVGGPALLTIGKSITSDTGDAVAQERDKEAVNDAAAGVGGVDEAYDNEMGLGRVRTDFNEMFGGTSNSFQWHRLVPVPAKFPSPVAFEEVMGYEYDPASSPRSSAQVGKGKLLHVRRSVPWRASRQDTEMEDKQSTTSLPTMTSFPADNNGENEAPYQELE